MVRALLAVMKSSNSYTTTTTPTTIPTYLLLLQQQQQQLQIQLVSEPLPSSWLGDLAAQMPVKLPLHEYHCLGGCYDGSIISGREYKTVVIRVI